MIHEEVINEKGVFEIIKTKMFQLAKFTFMHVNEPKSIAKWLVNYISDKVELLLPKDIKDKVNNLASGRRKYIILICL